MDDSGTEEDVAVLHRELRLITTAKPTPVGNLPNNSDNFPSLDGNLTPAKTSVANRRTQLFDMTPPAAQPIYKLLPIVVPASAVTGNHMKSMKYLSHVFSRTTPILSLYSVHDPKLKLLCYGELWR